MALLKINSLTITDDDLNNLRTSTARDIVKDNSYTTIVWEMFAYDDIHSSYSSKYGLILDGYSFDSFIRLIEARARGGLIEGNSIGSTPSGVSILSNCAPMHGSVCRDVRYDQATTFL